jgi:hypothetical protein
MVTIPCIRLHSIELLGSRHYISITYTGPSKRSEIDGAQLLFRGVGAVEGKTDAEEKLRFENLFFAT